MMKASELRDMTHEELDLQLRETKKELFNLRFQHALGELDNPLRIREVRRDIARILGVIRERGHSLA